MPDRYYAFAVGRIRVLETRLLSRGRLERMAEAVDLGEALGQLGETEYSTLLTGGREPREIAGAELARVRDLVLRLAPDAYELAFLLWRWDLLNLKALLRREEGGVRDSLNRLGRYMPEEMTGWFKDGRPELPDFFALARRAGESAQAASHDPQLVDAAVDRLYYAEGTKVWPDGSFMVGYWRARVDLINLRVLARSKLLGFDRARLAALLLDGGLVPAERFLSAFAESWEEIAAWWGQSPYRSLLASAQDLRRLSTLERASEDLLLERAKAAKGVPLGLEPVLGYYLAKEHETRLVNLVLTAKAAGVAGALIKERLRGVYA